jgi:hypothetical protein
MKNTSIILSVYFKKPVGVTSKQILNGIIIDYMTMKTKPTRSHPVLNVDSGKIVNLSLCIFFLSLLV